MDVSIRRATGDDAQAVATAHVRAWQVAYQGMVPAEHLGALNIDERTDRWRQNLTESALPDGTPAPTNLVAEIAGAVVGFACVGVWRDEPGDIDAAELWAMYVDPDHWGAGAGFALMGATVDLFADQGCQTGYLWVLDDNAPARRFYERQGWVVNDVTKDDEIGGATIVERRYSLELG